MEMCKFRTVPMMELEKIKLQMDKQNTSNDRKTIRILK